ncbi:glycine--tRNA ligase subunit beta [Umezakia ovalisporum]|jgi:glycyl-tRNA synthetase beta chain|uniref:Glycine--tRNA ligase beta subunit n=2 Tax=Umezakia ovalisporum TaxID=75695 RepID=A0AA43GZZ9_9CYAN|nr:glycine--tRNA ligase subunit beta [Umezakia ovalisporum]MDH6057421.1 glycine--tRNA ligase subunit beta [Umezakia ovalisporum FSS-43]MDH6064218.1 glycine--tRNA ligase subunit beta [Umezakia ovalisporum FSS-62]MDH6065933.1 glycine--tRNA ligase subunit beta [Umezakia ovalisporum APH033B]MDH6070811.1 glycine--tRNA ligase subunit beta [Umezakia ovalisporum CobakiLakeA]MDH6074929.1 glycine--tRNA ligase subunit beta [Umezakia ovalisporum CS-1034]
MAAFLLEIGTEELPASFLGDAILQWRSRIPQSLEANSLIGASTEVYGTPRRLAVLITDLPSQQPDREEEIKGPPVQAAFKDGQPTPAATGFAKKQSVDIAALEIRSTDKGDFVFVKKSIPGRPVAEILTELVNQWICGLEGKRLMRWGDGDMRFSRPIRWLVALLDNSVLPIELVNGSEIIKSHGFSYGHRVLHPQPVTVPQATDYVKTLGDAFVIVDPQERANIIQQQVQTAAEKAGGFTVFYPDLLAEVTNLVEFPSAVVGKFEPEFLQLPTEVITEVMVTHQRYFPVFKGTDGKELLANFITVANGDPNKSDIIALGNERVIRARLADGKFFYKSDLAKSLESYLPQLETVTFQEELGSVRAKVNRIVTIADYISSQLQLEEGQRQKIQRAALLCKADLVSQMVYEFPELQGVMGEKYALASGEDPEVARAIVEHYLPTGAGDIFPRTLVGQVVGLADRLDTLVSIFGLGLIPTGSSDPFALRRAANGIINITWAANLPINLENLLTRIATDFAAQYHKEQDKLIANLQEFFLQRIRTLLQDEKQIDYDLVNAVLGENDREYIERALKDLLDVRDRASYLHAIRADGTLDNIYETINRSTRLAAQGDLDFQQLEPTNVIQPELFQKSSELAFYNALVECTRITQQAQQSRNYKLLIAALQKIAPTVANFFDGEDSVLVMDPNPEIKRNRLHLLGLLRNHGRVLADFGAIVKNL